MSCKLCGLEHRGWVSCAKAHVDSIGKNLKEETEATIANTVANEPAVANRHGVYADKEKRKAYMRELMRKRRAK